MSTISSVLPRENRQPKIWGKMLALTIALAVIAFLASPNGPLGSFWRPSSDEPMPTSAQLPFFVVMNLAEVITFGLGVSFLIFAFPLVRAIAPASQMLTRLAHTSIAGLLLNWWPHLVSTFQRDESERAHRHRIWFPFLADDRRGDPRLLFLHCPAGQNGGYQ